MCFERLVCVSGVMMMVWRIVALRLQRYTKYIFFLTCIVYILKSSILWLDLVVSMTRTAYKHRKVVKRRVSFVKKFGVKGRFGVKFLLISLILLGITIGVLKNLSDDTLASWSPTHGNWLKRRQLNVVNSSAATLHSSTPIAVSIDTKTLVSQGRLRPDCADLRILYQPSDTVYTELSRYLVYPGGLTCSTSTATKVYFSLQADLSSSAASTYYYLYYNNPQATTPSNQDNAFDMGAADALLVCPFSGSTTCAAGETPSTATGAIRYGGAGSALSFDGVNDKVALSSDSTLTTSITFETWIKWNGSSDWSTMYQSGTQSNYWVVSLDPSGKLAFTEKSILSSLSTGTVTPNTWTHIAVVKNGDSGTNITLYINGTASGTASVDTVNTPSGTANIGTDNGSQNFPGLIDEVRVSNITRYSSNFIPQTSPLVRDEYTKLLLHFDENGDDPRQTGKALDDSGNSNHGTITGAKYVGGLVGVDNSSSTTGAEQTQTYSSHEGVFLEEGTTNKITNPSFENSTYNTNWSTADGTVNYNSSADTFTAGMSKRNSAGPFAAGIMKQSKWVDASKSDVVGYSPGTDLASEFRQYFDFNQGSIVFWITPEWNGNDGLQHYFLLEQAWGWLRVYKNTSNDLVASLGSGTATVSIASWTAGSTYLVTIRWDSRNTLNGSDYISIGINDSHTFGGNMPGNPSSITPGTIYIGSYDPSDGYRNGANALIEGLTIYRRPLWDGAYGTNIGSGDEINLIWGGAIASSKDPTLITGSWDVVFALPTNAVSGSIATGTGNAWSHPHSSNLVGNTGVTHPAYGFMMDGTYTNDGWAIEANGGADPTVAALDTAEKIFAGGYKITSNGVTANQGISNQFAATNGGDYVVRAVGNGDASACVPQVLITRADNTEITHLNGTTASTRTDPDVYIFTFESPAAENLKVKLINTAVSGTCYWHQVEVLSNLLTNPSFESGSNDPWIPTGWYQGDLDAGDSEVETTNVHSGSSSMQLNAGVSQSEYFFPALTTTSNKFYSYGGWTYGDGGASAYWWATNSVNLHWQHALSVGSVAAPSSAAWSHTPGVFQSTTTGALNRPAVGFTNITGQAFVDDMYSYTLTDVSLTVTPASEANSLESSGLRVDGLDSLTQTITNLTDKSGEVSFEITPRHNYDVADNFGTTTPVIAHLYGDANDYIKIVKVSDTVLRAEAQLNGTAINADTSVAPTLNAGTTYIIKVTYLQGSFLKLYIDGVEKASTAIGASTAFSTTPTTIYFGSDNSSTNQYDLTIDNASVTAPTISENTSAPYYKFGSKSAKVDNTSGDAGNFVTTVDPDSTATHTLSAYIYDGTTGNIGGTVDSKVASLVFEGSTKTTTYTDMGGGWWRLSYSGATTDASNTYGVHVTNGKTVYVDGVQLEAVAHTTSYADGSLGTGYAWTGTANESTSTRTVAHLRYSSTNNYVDALGSVSFWYKHIAPVSWRTIFATNSSVGNGHINLVSSGTTLYLYDGSNQTQLNNAFPTTGSWYHIVITWNAVANSMTVKVNNSLSGSAAYTSRTVTELSLGNILSGGGDIVQLSDLRIFSDVLSSDGISDLYYSGLMSRQETGQTIAIDRFDENKGQGPLGIYHFDEGYGTTTNDSTTNLNHLTLSGATWIGGSQSVAPRDTYLKFDGTDDKLSRAFDQDFNFGTGELTLSGLYRHPSTISGTDTILSRQTGSTGYKVYMNSSGYLCFSVNSDSTCTTTSYADSRWHHFEAVRGATTLTLYIDGKQASQATGLTATTVNGTNTLYIGVDSDGASNYFDGFLDEIYIYPSARTSAQVLADYNDHSSALISSRINDNLTDGLVGWWKMDETSGNRVDSSGNGNTLTDNNTVTSNPGKYGNAGQFTAANSEYLSIASNSTFETGDVDFTVSSWVYFDSMGRTAIINKDGNSAGKREFLVMYDTGVSRFVFVLFHNGGNTFSTVNASNFGAATTGTWYFVVARYDSVKKVMYISINGGAENSASTVGTTPIVTSQALKIGYPPYAAYMDGRIDEVRFYKRLLSSTEISQLYESAPGPVAHWKFDEGLGTSAYDISGNNNVGTLGGDGIGTDLPSWNDGKYGKALLFDGSDDYVDVTNNDLLNFDTKTAFTFSIWTKKSKNGSTQVILDKRTGEYTGYVIFHGSDNKIYLRSTNPTDLASVSTITDTNWHNITVTDNRSGSRKLYIDGKLDNTDAVDTSANSISSNIVLRFGNNANPGGQANYYYKGSLDDIRIYNYARTQKQIVADMLGSGQTVTAGGGSFSAGSGLSGSKPSAPVAYYKFDEGQGITANNSGTGGSALNGTLTSMSSPATATSGWTNNGKFNKGINFDGDNDYVTISDNPAFTLSNGFTLSAWVKASAFSGETRSIINQWGNNGAGNSSWLMRCTASGYLGVYTNNGSSSTSVVDDTSPLQLGQWYHVVSTYTGGSTGTNGYLYINGKLVKSGTMSSIPEDSTNYNVVIGSSSLFAGAEWAGSIDEVKIYNYALSAEEVKVDFNRGSAMVLGAGNAETTLLTYDSFSNSGATTTEVSPLTWTGSTWAVNGGFVTNAPTLETERATNGNMETGNPPTGWGSNIGSPTVAGVADERTGGSGAQSLSVTLTGTDGRAMEQIGFVMSQNKWYTVDGWGKKVSGSPTVYLNLSDGCAGLTYLTSGTAGSAWTQLVGTGRWNTSCSYVKIEEMVAGGAIGNEARFDDISVRGMTLSSLFRTVDATVANVIAETTITKPSSAYITQGGLVLNLDSTSSPANFVIAYLNGTSSVRLDKVVAGTYTNLIATAVTYSAGAPLKVVKDGNSYSVYYNGAQVGTTQTISDAGIGSNTKHGLFSTHSAQTFDSFSLKTGQVNYSYTVPGDIASTSGPVAEWKFDEGAGQSANDTSGNNYTGTLGSGATADSADPVWSAGKYGKGLNFDGNNDYVGMGNLNVTGDWTISLWTNTDSSTADIQYPLSTTGANTGLFVEYGTHTDAWGFYDGTNTLDGSNLSEGSWYHLTVVKSGLTYTLYKNGILENSGTRNDVDLSGVSAGRRGDGLWYYDGKVDNIQVYNYARTPAQIAWDYNRGGPVGWWKLDECTGTVAHDASGNQKNGTITIGATLPQSSAGNCSDGQAASAWYNGRTGKLSSSLNFDGVDDYVEITDETNSVFDATDYLTMSGWMYPTSDPGNTGHPIVYKGSGSDDYGRYLIGIYNNGGGIGPECVINGGARILLEDGSIPLNTWTHITCTYDKTLASNNVKVYINGKLHATANYSTSITADNNPVEIGRWYNFSEARRYFAGQLDDVRVYNYALTSSQVKTLYSGGAVRFDL